jgi:hypothetical protein
MPKPPAIPSASAKERIAERLVEFVSSTKPIRWSRVLAMILMMGSSLGCAVFWTERQSLVPLLRTLVQGQDTTINEAEAPAVLSRLLATTGAKVTVAYAWDLERYTRRLIQARTQDGRLLLVGLDERPITAGPSGYQLVGALLMAETPCFEIDNRAAIDTLLIQRMEGVNAFCIVGIPPSFGLGVRGAVSVFLPRLPSEAEAAGLRVALRAAAASLARRGT